jgi:hypothetical protein
MELKSLGSHADAVERRTGGPHMADATHTPLAVADEVDRLTAHLMTLDLDAQTLEILMAALAVEVCDHLDTPED